MGARMTPIASPDLQRETAAFSKESFFSAACSTLRALDLAVSLDVDGHEAESAEGTTIARRFCSMPERPNRMAQRPQSNRPIEQPDQSAY
jgi:hypothetical protein